MVKVKKQNDTFKTSGQDSIENQLRYRTTIATLSLSIKK